MAYTLGRRSRMRLKGVHPDLVCVVERAIALTPVDFTLLEGVRSLERQYHLLEMGVTTTIQSRHLSGHAVDLAAWIDGAVCWDWPHYQKIAAAMKQAGDELDIPIEWGGDWKSLKDGPHFQLPWAVYPRDQQDIEQ